MYVREEAKKERDSKREVCYLQLAERIGKGREEEGAINLSGDRFRPADLLVLILLRSRGEKM